mgnify:CR=1 FL=1
MEQKLKSELLKIKKEFEIESIKEIKNEEKIEKLKENISQLESKIKLNEAITKKRISLSATPSYQKPPPYKESIDSVEPPVVTKCSQSIKEENRNSRTESENVIITTNVDIGESNESLTEQTETPDEAPLCSTKCKIRFIGLIIIIILIAVGKC